MGFNLRSCYCGEKAELCYKYRRLACIATYFCQRDSGCIAAINVHDRAPFTHLQCFWIRRVPLFRTMQIHLLGEIASQDEFYAFLIYFLKLWYSLFSSLHQFYLLYPFGDFSMRKAKRSSLLWLCYFVQTNNY